MFGKPAAVPAESDPTFVGRAEALRLFDATLAQALDGRRQILTICGEPGIGKTRCAEAFAGAAEDRCALVLWGRCYEEPGAPPYWPWVQVLREFIAASSANEVQLAIGAGVEEIASLVPEIGASAPPSAHWMHESEPAARRFRLFDAIARLFARATQQVPIVAMLDNVHWADAPSLSLLEFLSNELQRNRFMIVATYRDNEVSRKSPLLEALGGIARDTGVERIRLGGLAEPAIGALAEHVLGFTLPASAVTAIHQQTDGNPLFVIEIIKVLIEDSRAAGVAPIAVRIPDGVREAIGRRLARLPEHANALLAMAAVIGRGFSANELASLTGEDIAAVIAQLETIAPTSLIEVDRDAPAHYRFTHSLIRETLYDEIPTLERLKLHARVAETLERLHAHTPAPMLERIAHHYYAAATLGHTEKAVEFAQRAAEHAVAISALEEALVQLDRIVELLTLTPIAGQDERIARALFEKGCMLLHSGSSEPALQALLRAADALSGVNNAELLVDIAHNLVLTSSYASQAHAASLLEKVLSLLADADGHARARALATLAFASRSVTAGGEIDRLAEESVAMAERLGDAQTLCICLCMSVMALRVRPDTLDRRLALGRRWIEIAPGDSLHSLINSSSWQVMHLLEQGRIDAAESLNEHHAELCAKRFGLHEYFAATTRIIIALLRGEWSGLETSIEALRELGAKTRRDEAESVYGAQMFTLCRELGRIPELEAEVRAFAESPTQRVWAPGLMIMCADLGLLDKARSLFEQFAANDFAQLPRDDMYVANLIYCAETCCVLRDARRAAALHDLLLPYAEQTASYPRAVCFGSTRSFLARLAHVAQQHDAARSHFEHAVRQNREMRAWPALARTLCHYSELLQERGAVGAARAALAEAEEIANRLGMAGLVLDIDRRLRGRASETQYPDELTVREVDVLRLIAIGRSNKDISTVLSISLNTVATHVRNILSKTGCANRTEAAAYALRHAAPLGVGEHRAGAS